MIRRKPPLRKSAKRGEKIELFGKEKFKVELQHTLGDNYNRQFSNYKFHFYLKDNTTGTSKLIKKTTGRQIGNLNIKSESFKLISLTEPLNKGSRDRKIKQSMEFKTNDPNKNIIVMRRNKNELLKLTDTLTYDVTDISVKFWFRISDAVEERSRTIPQDVFNTIKQNLNLTNFITAQDIYNISETYVDAYINTIQGANQDEGAYGIYAYGVKALIRNNDEIFKLGQKGDEYYLLNDIRHYRNLNNYFECPVDVPEGKNCLIETMKYLLNSKKKYIAYKKNFKKEFSNIENEYLLNKKIPTYNDLIKLLNIGKINHKIINWTDKKDGQENIYNISNKTAYFVIFDNHIYFIEDDQQFKNILNNSYEQNDKFKFLSSDKFDSSFDNIINENTPHEILKIEQNWKEKDILKRDIVISAYKKDNICYIKDDEDKTNRNLNNLCAFMHIPYSTYINECNFINVLLKNRNIKEKKSFFLYDHTSKEYLYNSGETVEDEANFKTMDMNLCYPNILIKLDKIPIINNLINKISKFDISEEITENYYYSIKILKNDSFNLYIRNSDIYAGYYLALPEILPTIKKMLINKEIEIIDKIECEWIDNPYKDILEEMLSIIKNTDNKNDMRKTIKKCINRFIGKFELSSKQNIIYEKNYELIKNKPETCHINDQNKVYKFNDEYLISYESEEKNNYGFNLLENHKPLRTLIINMCGYLVIKLINEFNIDEKDILQINTDGITYRNYKNDPEDEYNLNTKNKKRKPEDEIYYSGKYNYIEEYIEKNNEDNKHLLYGLKMDEYKPKKVNYYINDTFSFTNNIIKPNNKFECVLKYAGSGKSHSIKEHIKQYDNNYIILAPLRKVLKIYKNLNKKTVQHFTRNYIIPEQDNIIIDEAFLINNKDFKFVMTWALKFNKNIFLFGDPKQLPPVEKTTNKQLLNLEFLKSISTLYTDYNKIDINYRNNFTFDIYNELIKNGYTQAEIIKLICYFINDRCDTTKKYYNICYRNDTKDKVNNLMLEQNKQTFNKEEIKGLNIPIISKKNFKVKTNNYLVCSKDEFILNCIDSKYLLTCIDDEEDNKKIIEITFDELIKYFDVAYCYTLYYIQGQTLDNFNFILDDVYFLQSDNQFNIKGALYTLISRIKEELTEKKITIDDINEILLSYEPKKNIINNMIKQSKFNNSLMASIEKQKLKIKNKTKK